MSKTVGVTREDKLSEDEASEAKNKQNARDRAVSDWARALEPPIRLVDDRQVVPDHPDHLDGWGPIMKALGTTNINFARGVVWQLYSACVYADKVDEDKLNYMFAIVTSFKPKDEVEAMVSVQFALTQTEMGRQACGYLNADLLHMATEGRLQAEQTFASNSCKFARTSIALIDALVRYRAGGDQKVTVQQNVLVSEGGRAIVGNLTQPERVTESPHVAPPPLTHSQVAPMPPVETAVRAAVPLVRKKRNEHARP